MLENLDIALAELVTKVESLSPKLWEIALRQVWVNLFGAIIVLLVCSLIVSFGIYFIIKIIRYTESGNSKYDCDTRNFWMTILIIAVIISIILIFVSIYEIGAILINPEYEALKIILQLIK